MIDAGKYNKKIEIVQVTESEDSGGFKQRIKTVILRSWASVRTTNGFTLIANGSDFEKAYTNFTIRHPKTTITRDMLVRYAGKEYSIEYLNNVNEDSVELEMQCKEVTK